MIACPSCKRKIFTRRDMLYAALDGTAPCRACGRAARLDLLSRWMISCVLALILPTVLLYGGVFYSGHLFLVSIFVILGGWRILSLVGFPLLTLEAAGDSAIDRRQSIVMLVVMLVIMIIMDGYMSSRFDSDNAPENGSSPSAAHRDR